MHPLVGLDQRLHDCWSSWRPRSARSSAAVWVDFAGGEFAFAAPRPRYRSVSRVLSISVASAGSNGALPGMRQRCLVRARLRKRLGDRRCRHHTRVPCGKQAKPSRARAVESVVYPSREGLARFVGRLRVRPHRPGLIDGCQICLGANGTRSTSHCIALAIAPQCRHLRTRHT